MPPMSHCQIYWLCMSADCFPGKSNNCDRFQACPKLGDKFESPWGRQLFSRKFKGLQQCRLFFICARSFSGIFQVYRMFQKLHSTHKSSHNSNHLINSIWPRYWLVLFEQTPLATCWDTRKSSSSVLWLMYAFSFFSPQSMHKRAYRGRLFCQCQRQLKTDPPS